MMQKTRDLSRFTVSAHDTGIVLILRSQGQHCPQNVPMAPIVDDESGEEYVEIGVPEIRILSDSPLRLRLFGPSGRTGAKNSRDTNRSIGRL
jgi:hypothetical protein